MKKTDYMLIVVGTAMVTLGIALITYASLLQSKNNPTKQEAIAQVRTTSRMPHLCSFKGCLSVGSYHLVTDETEGTDSYYYDVTHFNHPEFTQDQIEDYMFSHQ